MNETSAPGLLETLADDGVLELLLNLPDRRNPLGSAMVARLLDALERADADAAVRVILIRGAGEAFSAGAELREFADLGAAPAHEIHVLGNGWASLITRFRDMDTPIVVAAHGYAIAGAVGLVAAADVAVAAQNARFATREVKIGLFPLMIYPAVRDAIGPRRARELALTGRMIDANEALRIGLVHRVLPEENFAEQARAAAAEMAQLGRETMRLSKEYLRSVEESSFGPAVALGRATRGAFLSSPDFAEGVAAFFEKRPSKFD